MGTWLLAAQQADPLGTRGTSIRTPVDFLMLHEEGSWLRVHALSGRHVQQDAGRWSLREGAVRLEGVMLDHVNAAGVREPKPVRRRLPVWRLDGRITLGDAASLYVQHGGRVLPDLGIVAGFTRPDGSSTLLPRKWENLPAIVRDFLGRVGDAGL